MQNLRKRVPTILTADEILDKAFRKVNKIDKQGPDKVELVKRKSMARIASATDVISSTLRSTSRRSRASTNAQTSWRR